MKKFGKNFWINFLVVLFLFIFAFLIRTGFDQGFKNSSPVRDDAFSYVATAYNLKFYDLYTDDKVVTKETRNTISKVQVGYPLFISFFLEEDFTKFVSPEGDGKGLKNLYFVQKVLSSLIVVIIYLISLLFFSKKISFFIALLTSLNPFFVSFHSFVLTECFFTFLLTLGIYIFFLANKFKNKLLLIFSVLILSFAFEVRIFLFGFLIFLSGLLFIKAMKFTKKKLDKKYYMTTALLFFIIPLFVSFSDQVFIKSKSEGLVEKKEEVVINVERNNFEKYFDVLAKIKISKVFGVPRFYHLGEDTIIDVVQRDDVSLKNAKSFLAPSEVKSVFSLIGWHLIGKISSIWRYQSVYVDEPFFYPVEESVYNFSDEQIFFEFSFRVLKLLHWPLFALTLLAIFIIFKDFWKDKTNQKKFDLLVICLLFLYFVLTFFLINTYLTRYNIPVRHLSYLLAFYPVFHYRRLIK